MTIYRINPDLLKPEGASDGDVITYVSANSRVEWAAPSGGGGDVANVWVNANDYATYTSITANVNSVNSNVDSIAANLYNSYTTLTANDYNSYTTLTANIYNTYTSLFANLGVGGGNVTNTVSITPVFSGALRTTSATQTLGAASWTTLTGYDNVIYDTNSFTSVADRFTIPAGVTKVKLAGSVAGTSAIGQLITRILKNANTAISYTTEVDIESTGADNGIAITPVVSVVEGDYFVIQAFSDNSRTVSVELVSWFSIEVVEGSVLTATANLTISSAGNAWVNANDFSTYSTLTANIYNTFAYLNANVGGGGDASNAWVNANDYNTYTTLSGLIDLVQDNVAAISGGGGGELISDQFTVSSSNIFTLSQAATSANNILVSLNGIVQKPTDDYIVSGTTLTLANVDPLSSGIAVEVRHLSASTGGGGISLTDLSVTTAAASGNGALSYSNTSGVFTFTPADTSGGGGGGITTGKAIAMAMIFGG